MAPVPRGVTGGDDPLKAPVPLLAVPMVTLQKRPEVAGRDIQPDRLRLLAFTVIYICHAWYIGGARVSLYCGGSSPAMLSSSSRFNRALCGPVISTVTRSSGPIVTVIASPCITLSR